jgi:hypothetical protein
LYVPYTVVFIPSPGVVDSHGRTGLAITLATADRIGAAMATFTETDAMDPRAAAIAAASVKMEEFRRNMLDYTETMTSLGLIPSRPPPKRWFPRLARLWRLFLVRINR